MAIAAATMVSLGGSVFVIGGQSFVDGNLYFQDTIYELQCPDQTCKWLTLTQYLQHKRARHISMLIPDELTDCSQEMKHTKNRNHEFFPITVTLFPNVIKGVCSIHHFSGYPHCSLMWHQIHQKRTSFPQSPGQQRIL